MRAALLVLALAAAGCRAASAHELDASASPAVDLSAIDFERPACQKRIAAALAEPAAPGAPLYERRRVDILARAYGEPVWFVEAPPKPAHDWADAYADGLKLPVDLRPTDRIVKLKEQVARKDLRKLLLRGGYVYAEDPHAAYALVRELGWGDLFDEPVVFVARGAERLKLARDPNVRAPYYRYADGPLAGAPARLMFADRAAVDPRELDPPLHRDLRGLAERVGFDRMTPEHVGRGAIVAKLRFGARWVRALLRSDGARVELDCLDADRDERAAVAAFQAETAWRRRAYAALHAAAEVIVGEELPFDRPHDVHDHLQDGKLRPSWELAYRQGKPTYGLEPDGHGYYVYDQRGRPFPPETCVAMVLDSYERASGTWYRPRGEPPGRSAGAIDFDALGLVNRAGVLAFEQFAEAHPELFAHTRYRGAERVPFAQRDAFFGFLAAHADDFAPGDVLAIQGPKRDGYVHQHAILLVEVDPVTGFPYGLADQMNQPRRRSWEGVMAEAPKRALLYHLKPTDALLGRLDPKH